jgi:hypothetical protein
VRGGVSAIGSRTAHDRRGFDRFYRHRGGWRDTPWRRRRGRRSGRGGARRGRGSRWPRRSARRGGRPRRGGCDVGRRAHHRRQQPSPGGERFRGKAYALAYELARAPGDRRGEPNPEHGQDRDQQGPARSAHWPAAGNSSTATAPPPGRFPRLASPCQALASVLAIARPSPLPPGPSCPARPR